MSAIVHRCPDCGHNDLEHPATPAGKSTCSYGSCACRTPRRVVAENPPEVIPSWDAVTSALIPSITTPGEVIGQQKGAVRTCACDACRALYDEKGGMA